MACFTNNYPRSCSQWIQIENFGIEEFQRNIINLIYLKLRRNI